MGLRRPPINLHDHLDGEGVLVVFELQLLDDDRDSGGRSYEYRVIEPSGHYVYRLGEIMFYLFDVAVLQYMQ